MFSQGYNITDLFYWSSQDYIARFGHGSAKLARQAQSKEKVLSKMVANGLTEKVARDKVRTFPYQLFFYSIYKP